MHRHASDVSGEAHDEQTFDGTSHAGAASLGPVWSVERVHRLELPAPACLTLLTDDARTTLGRLDRRDDPPIHGPPLLVRSLRAPPA